MVQQSRRQRLLEALRVATERSIEERRRRAGIIATPQPAEPEPGLMARLRELPLGEFLRRGGLPGAGAVEIPAPLRGMGPQLDIPPEVTEAAAITSMVIPAFAGVGAGKQFGKAMPKRPKIPKESKARAAEVARGQAEMPVAAAKEPWQMPLAEFSTARAKAMRRTDIPVQVDFRSDMALRRAYVERALSEGKPVPPEVLADYPDLARAAAKPIAPSVAQPAPGVVSAAKPGARIPSVQPSPVTAAQPGATAVERPSPLTATPAEAQQVGAAPAPSGAGGVTPPSPGQPPPPAGRPPTTTGAPPPEEPFAANIRLSKYPAEARTIIKAWADAHPAEVQAARRGIRSDAQVLEDAQRLIDEAGGNSAKIVKRQKPGEAYNAEEITALRGLLREKAITAAEAQRLASQSNSAENQAAFFLALQEQATVQKMVHGGSAEIGRALRAHRMNAQAFATIGQADRATKMEALLKRIGPGRERMDEIAAAMSRIDLDNPYAVNTFIRDITEPKLWDYVMEVYYNAILSGPKTHIINEVSNTAVALLSPFETAAAAATEQVLARLQGRAVERYFAEVPAEVRGMIEGVPEGVRAFFSTLQHGISPSAATKWEFRPRAFRGWFGRVVNASSTLLEAADALNYSVNYRMALRARVVRMARQQAKGAAAIAQREAELLLSTPAELVEEAAKVAEQRLFRGEPGEIVRTLIRLRDWTPKGLGGAQPLRFAFPFLRTPGNLLEFGLTRSPAAWLNPKMWSNVVKKNPEAADQIGRAVLGTIGALGIVLLFRQGKITGAAPTSQAARDRFYREGKQPYSVRIGDTWIQYQRLEPFNQALAQVAAALEALEAKDKSANDRIGQAMATLGNNLVSQTYLSGFADTLNAIQQPERYGERLLTRPLTGMVPYSSLLRTVAQQQDPTFRRPETFLQRLQAGIPGLTEGLPPRLTAFGEEAQRPKPVWSPIALSPAEQSAVDAELERLGIEVGFVSKTIGGVELMPAELHDYQQQAGQGAYNAIRNLLTEPRYLAADDVTKEKEVRRAVERVREAARADWVMVNGTPAQKKMQIYDDALPLMLRTSEPLLTVWNAYKELPDGSVEQDIFLLQHRRTITALKKLQGEVRERMRRNDAELDTLVVDRYGAEPLHPLNIAQRRRKQVEALSR